MKFCHPMNNYYIQFDNVSKIVIGADSAISLLQCNQVLCLTTPVQYQCIVTDSIIQTWRIKDETMTTLDTRAYSTGDNLKSSTPLANVPDFSTDLSSTSPSIISDISYTVQSSINGYTIQCVDAGGDSENCTINIQGDCLIELFDLLLDL